MSKKTEYCICARGDQLVTVAVTAQDDGRWQVEEVTSFSTEAGPPSGLGRTLSRNSRQLTWLLQDEESNVAVAYLPRLKSKEMDRAVAGWLLREQGGDAATWACSWQATASIPDNPGEPEQNEVSLVFAKREDVDRYAETAAQWRFRPGSMLPDYMALERFFRLYGPDSNQAKGWNLVFVGKRRRFLCIGTESNLLLTRNLPLDLSADSDPVEYLDRLATEVDRSVFFARQTQQNPQIEKIIVCGDPDLSAALIQRLADESNIPAEMWDLTAQFQWGDVDYEPDLLLPTMAAALGKQRSPFNLLPAPKRTLFGPRMRKRSLVAVGTVAAAAVPLLLVGGLVTSKVQERYLDRARMRVAEAEMRADEAAEVYRGHGLLLAQEDYIREHAATNRDFEAVLLRLASFTPEGITYRDMQLRRQEAGGYMLHLTGISNASTSAAAQAAFLEFLAAMNDCDILITEGEPSQLQITTQDKQGVIHKQVVFSLEYTILPTALGQEG